MRNLGTVWMMLLILIALGIASRLLPHWHNFTAVGAAAMFGGFFFRKGFLPYLIPLLTMWLSDLFLNNVVYHAFQDQGFTLFSSRMISVYAGFMTMAWLGSRERNGRPGSKLLILTLAGSLAFFIISNFGSFLLDYPITPAGLAAAYLAAIPFFWNTLLANLFYSFLFFGVYHYYHSHVLKLKSHDF